MSKILIVGNVTKDVYLRLDNRQNRFETDGTGVAWLDLAFDGSSYRFYARHAVYGGAAVSLEVLARFGMDVKVLGSEMSFADGGLIGATPPDTYRYIMAQDDDVAYFSSSQRQTSRWVTPSESVDCIYIDPSANVSRELSERVLDYLESAKGVKLAVFLGKRTGETALERLHERADLVFSETEDCETNKCVHISDSAIQFDGERVNWSLGSRQNMVTHLTSKSMIAASILGAVVQGKSASTALLLAKANVENANLDGALNMSRLEETIVGKEYELQRVTKKEKNMSEIEETAARLMAAGKGILAADESGGSIEKKFAGMGIPDTEQNRRDYRNIFFTTPSLAQYASGVILFDETARQKADDGKDFVSFLQEKGVVAGVKVDQGLENFEGSDEKWTKGLEGLPERLAKYYRMGARFAKWRAAFEILGEGVPSEMAIAKNAEILAQYAKDCQEAGIVPIVEPEVVYDGDYTIEQNAEVTGRVLDKLFSELRAKEVNLRGCILKVNMILAGKKQEHQSTAGEVGRATAVVLREHVPEEMAGVVFLSGGQSVGQATENLQAVTNEGPFPWPVTFSFARALQDPALNTWRGDNANTAAAREAFAERLAANAAALRKNN